MLIASHSHVISGPGTLTRKVGQVIHLVVVVASKTKSRKTKARPLTGCTFQDPRLADSLSLLAQFTAPNLFPIVRIRIATSSLEATESIAAASDLFINDHERAASRAQRLLLASCHVISGPALDKDPHVQPSEGHESMIDLPRRFPRLK